MKIIFKIAKNELRYLFYSPIAWFVLIVFLIQCGYFYGDFTYNLANWQEVMVKNSPGYKGGGSGPLTFASLFRSGLFENAIGNLYLFVPLLTMGLINREVNAGSVKLLFSSPVKLRQIVLGKYLGIMLYNLLLVGIIGIFMIAIMFNVIEADYTLLLSAIFGFYLLVCAYSAIGLFMSSLSTYQVVSALSTFVIIFALSRIDALWQKYDFIRDITYFLSLQNRTLKMLVGLIVSRDVIYFIVISALFIAFTLIKLRSGREAKPWYVRTGRYALVITIALAIGYTGSRPVLTGYLDATVPKTNTIPVPMQKIIKDMGDSALEVTLYTNLLGGGLGHGLPESRNADYFAGFWEPYLRFKPDIVFKFEYYYDTDPIATDSFIYKAFPGKNLKEIAGESAESIDADLSNYKTPEEMHQIINLQPESYRLVMRLKYKGRTEWLRTYDDTQFWPDLSNVSAAFKRLLRPRVPKVYFVTGELERSIIKTGEREYAVHTAAKYVRSALINNGYNVDTVNLATQPVPADADILALADPKMDIPPLTFSKLRNYVDTGGNLLVFGEPGKQYVLNPFLRQLGVQLMAGQLVQPTFDETPDKVTPYMLAEVSRLYTSLAGIPNLLKKRDTARILMTGVTGLSYTADSAFTVLPLLATEPGKTWLKQGELVIDSTLPPFDSRQGDVMENSFSTGLALIRNIKGKEQRIIILSDADFASNLRVGGNFSFLEPCYSWMTYNKFPLPMPRPDPKDLMLRVSEAGAAMQKTAYVWVLPGLMLLLAIILLIRRKRK